MSDNVVLVVKDKVQRYLSELVTFQVDDKGRYSFRYGSARVFVRVQPWRDNDALVAIEVPLLFGVQPQPELYRYIAETEWVYGHLVAVNTDNGVTVMYNHCLLGNFLDPDELKLAVALMAKTADEQDTKLRQMFGGSTFHEDEAPAASG